MKNFILLFIMALFLMNCKSSQHTLSAEQYKELQSWIANKTFEIESERANPKVSNGLNQLNSDVFGAGSNASNINLIGNPNYLRVRKDSVFAHLPYYGTRHRIKLSSNTGAIQFKTKLKNYSLEHNEAKNRTSINFEAKDDDGEIYDIIITVFENGNTTIHVNSSQRSTISYDGSISKFPKEKK